MKRSFVVIAFLGLLMTVSCAYHGAVYSEYTQFALDVRSTAESNAPIKVDLGYDRGVLAYVPKLDGKTGEACSLISWENVGANLATWRGDTDSVLTVDAGFISGTAAIVAAAPSNATVSIVPNKTSGEGAPEMMATGATGAGEGAYKVTTSGGSGARIAMALSFAPATDTVVSRDLQARRVALAKSLGTFSGAKANLVLAKAGFPTEAEDKAVAKLQDRILDAQTEEAVKKLEEAFKTVP